MAEMSIILSEIEVKVRKLIDAKNQLIEENRRLASENKALREENEAFARTSQELQDKINKTTIIYPRSGWRCRTSVLRCRPR